MRKTIFFGEAATFDPQDHARLIANAFDNVFV